MKKIQILCLFVIFATIGFAGDSFVLIDKKNANAPNCVIEKIGEWNENTAFNQSLQDFCALLEKISGVRIPIEEKNGLAGRNVLRFEVVQDLNPKTNDRFSFHFPDAETMLVRCSQVSLQWALNRILEEYANVRFLIPEDCGLSYYQMDKIEIPRKDRTFEPSFNMERSCYYSTPSWMKYQNFKPNLSFGHEFYSVVFPHAKYTGGYPERVLPVHKGKRLTQIPDPARPAIWWQPCFSSADSIKIAAENILEFLRNNPEKTSVSLTINDIGGFCECENCVRENGGKKNADWSEVYFKWVNAVAEIVTREFPDVLLPALAYAEVLQTPSFAVHPNVPVMLCLDLYAVTDPVIKLKNKKLIHDWSQKAATIGAWDYAWGYSYLPPRMYLKEQVEMMRYLYENNARIYFLEYECMDGHEGPKPYLYSRLLWDIDADVEAMLNEWYIRAVGVKAAPYLREYYEKWEAYFAGDEIRKTPWFGSAKYIYMTWGAKSHQYGLNAGEIASFRKLMEKVLELAETEQEKERAKVFMRRFEVAEALLTIGGAEPIPSNGNVIRKEEALELIANAGKAPKALQELKRLQDEVKQEPFIGSRMYHDLLGEAIRGDKNEPLVEQLCLAGTFADDESVKKAFNELAENKDLPEMVAAAAKYFGGQMADTPNLAANGDFEDISGDKIFPDGKGVISNQASASGKYAYKIVPGQNTTLFRIQKAEPHSIYLVTFKVLIPDCGSEAFMRNTVFSALNGDLCTWTEVAKTFIPAKEWRNFAMLSNTYDRGNELHINIEFGNFNPGEVVYIDDLKVVKIGSTLAKNNLSQVPVVPDAPEDFQTVGWNFAVNTGLADDASISALKYEDNQETMQLTGSKKKIVSHFFSQAAVIKVPNGAKMEYVIYARGKGHFIFGCYSYVNGTTFLGTSVENFSLTNEVEEIRGTVVPIPAAAQEADYELRPVIGFVGTNCQAEIIAIYYRIIVGKDEKK